MSALWMFLKDRIYYITAFSVAILTGCAIWMLEQAIAGNAEGSWNVLYFLLLSTVVLALFIVFDYLRNRTYLQQLILALETDGYYEQPRLLRGVTWEQRMVQELLAARHRDYVSELNRYKRQQELHHHFIHQWVHHMKTPVSVIDLIVQQGGDKNTTYQSDRQQADMLRSIGEETERLTRGLEQMLHTARLEKFELDLHIRRIALHDAARECINSHKRLMIRAGIFPVMEGEGTIETDQKWLTFILNQLISNAIKYSRSKSGSKRLFVRIENALAENSHVTRLIVQDEGIGIPSQDLPRVFDPFFTGENGRSSEESTGMGLYLVKQVCLRLGHRIEISADEEGATVIVEFSGGGLHEIIR